MKKSLKSLKKAGPRPIFHILRSHTKIDKNWMQMILRDVEDYRKSPHQAPQNAQYSPVKALICKKAKLLWLPTRYLENRRLHSVGHRVKVT